MTEGLAGLIFEELRVKDNTILKRLSIGKKNIFIYIRCISNSTDKNTKNGILFSLLILVATLISGINYSGAQDIPGQPSINDENGAEPEVQGAEPEVQGEEPTLKDDGQSQGQPPPQQSTLPIAYRIKVLFHSITVHDDEEPAPFDDGEYTMRAVVNGKYVNLDRGSGGKLWDVESGETVYFAPYTYAIFEIPSASFPVSIYTLGYEADACPRLGYGDVPSNDNIIPILKGPESEWLSEIRRIIDHDINVRTTADYNCNDRIGFVNKIHHGLVRDVGVMHQVTSTNADYPDNPGGKPNFTLRYTIYAEPIPPN